MNVDTYCPFCGQEFEVDVEGIEDGNYKIVVCSRCNHLHKFFISYRTRIIEVPYRNSDPELIEGGSSKK